MSRHHEERDVALGLLLAAALWLLSQRPPVLPPVPSRYRIGKLMGAFAWVERLDGTGGHLLRRAEAISRVRAINAGLA